MATTSTPVEVAAAPPTTTTAVLTLPEATTTTGVTDPAEAVSVAVDRVAAGSTRRAEVSVTGSTGTVVALLATEAAAPANCAKAPVLLALLAARLATEAEDRAVELRETDADRVLRARAR
jgi:hypothetical protein